MADEWGGPGSSKNAYVLIYEKEFKKDIKLEIAMENDMVEQQIVPYQ